jgi:hypothetical protein
MNRFRMRNVILPAVLVSSGVFSVLTLPFVLNKNEVVGFAPPAFLEEASQPSFDRESKNAAIRYVGGAIVVSVGAGVATIEILRRMHPANQLSKLQKDTLNSQIRKIESEAQPDPAALTEDVESAIAEFLRTASAASDQAVEPSHAKASLLHFEPETSTNLWEESAATQAAVESASDSVWMNANSSQNSRSIAASSSNQLFEQVEPISSFPGQSNLPYETYRIRVPHRQDTLFAILLEGEYYSLVRTHKSQEKILELATQLYQLGDRVIITSVGERYAVWVLQPEAYLEWVS